MRYLISVSYDGSKFYGFQRLNKKKTVQSELEKALTKINKTLVVVKGAGRTDRGVHAKNQKVHFDLNVNIPPDRLVNALNSLVRPYIKINSAEIVSNDFHARFNVVSKTYTYVINMGEFDPIKNDYLYNYNHQLNMKKMKQAAKVLLGPHSYEAFTSGKRENYNSIITSIKFKKKKDIMTITFMGKSFYRYMVRNLVGALILVGDEKITKEDLADILNKKKIGNYITAPASGLYLENIKY